LKGLLLAVSAKEAAGAPVSWRKAALRMVSMADMEDDVVVAATNVQTMTDFATWVTSQVERAVPTQVVDQLVNITRVPPTVVAEVTTAMLKQIRESSAVHKDTDPKCQKEESAPCTKPAADTNLPPGVIASIEVTCMRITVITNKNIYKITTILTCLLENPTLIPQEAMSLRYWFVQIQESQWKQLFQEQRSLDLTEKGEAIGVQISGAPVDANCYLCTSFLLAEEGGYCTRVFKTKNASPAPTSTSTGTPPQRSQHGINRGWAPVSLRVLVGCECWM